MMLRKMKGEIIKKEEYIKKKKEYRAWCKEEKRKREKEEEERIRQIGTEGEAWKYINRFRKRRKKVDEEIEMDKWRDYYMDLLRGTRQRTIMEEEEEEEGNEKEEGEITKEELRRLRKKKAPGENGIENEAWRFMSKEIGETM